MPRTIIAGEPGQVHRNDTARIQYQLAVNWHNSCGICIQFDHQVGDFWPVPFHRSCRCKNIPILPDHPAAPFVDFRAEILKVSPQQQAAIMGRSNLAMVESGLVKWDDVVTPGRIRSLREVAHRNKLSVDQMVKAGVAPRLAREAHEAVHTGTHTAAETRRHEAVRALLDKGYTREQIRDAAGHAIGARLSIGTGPSGPSVIAPRPLTPKPTPTLSELKPGTKQAALKAKPAETPALAQIRAAVAFAEARGVKVVPTAGATLREAYGDAAALKPAVYNAATKLIYINEANAYWSDAAAVAADAERRGWFSTGDPDHVIAHETGHALHDRSDPVKYQAIRKESLADAQREMIRASVSGYGATKPVEFVAEVFAGLTAGKVYDSDVMDLYRSLGGPQP